MSKIWFVTGSSTGFGRLLCKELARRGERTVATARNLDDIRGLESEHTLTAELDVTKPETIKRAVEHAMERFGRIDVLVNNAGYGEMGVIEEFSDERAKRQFETNVFGVLNVQREVLPVLRRQRSGHILQLSSISGIASYPFVGMYCATKHALEAVSEALAQEIEPFGIKVTLVEPGRFRTDFAGRSLGLPDVKEGDYKELTLDRIGRYNKIDGNQPGDPQKAVEAMIAVVESPSPPLRLLLGKDAYDWANEKLDAMRRDFEAWKEVTLSTDFEDARV
jgi:NAD(P)-dependent dehydrogenase (short-subunit alcohol dehydrogenase family)